MDPAFDALLHVLRIEIELDVAGARERLERADDGRQLHPVVRRLRLAAEDLLLASVELQQRAPATGAGIALACAVGINDDAAHCSVLRASRFGADSRLGRPGALIWTTLRASRFGADSRLGRPGALIAASAAWSGSRAHLQRVRAPSCAARGAAMPVSAGACRAPSSWRAGSTRRR